jgi:Lipid A core - O-antigen ligase and related enzymes
MIQASRTVAPRFVPVDVAAVLTFIALSALVLNPIFRSLSAATFLGFGCLLIASNIQHSAWLFARWWYLLLLPAYCLLSTLWSQYPELTLRYSLQLGLTLAIAIVIAGRITPTSLLRMLFVVYAIGVVLSLAIGYRPMGSAWLGIFGSKNAFAAHVAVFALVSVAILFDRNSPLILRLGGLGGALISPPLLVLAQSAGAIMMVVPCVGIILAVMLTERLTGMQKVFLAVCGLIGTAAFALFLMTNGETLLADILNSSGKDATLTGRTDLWAIGLSFIAERPLQGLGYRAFWVPGFAPAEQLWAMFLVPSGAGFNFHNTYISNAVEIGLVGLGLQVFIIYGGAILMTVYALARPTAENAFLLGMQVLLILRSFIEVEVFFEFSVRSILAVATFVYAAHGLAMLMRSAPSSVPRRQPSPPAAEPRPGLVAGE